MNLPQTLDPDLVKEAVGLLIDHLDIGPGVSELHWDPTGGLRVTRNVRDSTGRLVTAGDLVLTETGQYPTH